MRVLNDDLNKHVEFQKTKKGQIENFERVMMDEDDYQELVDEVTNYDTILVSVSSKFSELTREAKKIIDYAKESSDRRKE